MESGAASHGHLFDVLALIERFATASLHQGSIDPSVVETWIQPFGKKAGATIIRRLEDTIIAQQTVAAFLLVDERPADSSDIGLPADPEERQAQVIEISQALRARTARYDAVSAVSPTSAEWAIEQALGLMQLVIMLAGREPESVAAVLTAAADSWTPEHAWTSAWRPRSLSVYSSRSANCCGVGRTPISGRKR